MRKYPTSVKKQLQQLAKQSTEAELTHQLSELAQHFKEWQQHNMSARELRHFLHTYVQGASRELFRRSREVPDDILVADAVARGFLDKDEISAEVWPYIQNGIQFYHDVLDKKSE